MFKRALFASALVLATVSPSVAEDMVVHVVGISGETSPPGTFLLTCQTRSNGLYFAPGFDVQLNYADNAAQKIAAIQDRAIVILGELGVTVTGSDKKTVFGAPNN